MMQGMTPLLFREWQAKAELYSFGERRADLRMAYLAKILWDINRDTKKQPDPFDHRMFLYQFEVAIGERKKEKQTEDQKFDFLTEFLIQSQMAQREQESRVRVGTRIQHPTIPPVE